MFVKKLYLYIITLLIFTGVFMVAMPKSASAVTCTSAGNGNWNATGTWTGCTGGNGSTANTPGSADTAIITGTHTVTVTANETVSALQFGTASTAGVVSVNTSVTLTVTNALTLLGLTTGNTAGTVTGAGTISAGSITLGSDVAYTGARTITLTSSITSLTSSGALTLQSYQGTNASRTGNVTLNHASGIVTVQGSLTTINETANNTSTFTMATGAESGTLNLSGATPFSLSGTGTNTITLNGTSAVVNYNGTSAQTVLGTTYTTLKINNSNSTGATLDAATTVSTLTIGDVTSNSNFNDGGYQITSTGTLNLTSGKFKLGSSSATTWPNFGTRNISSGTTVEYASTSDQTYSSTPTYHHLTFSGNSFKSASSTTLTVNGNLFIWAGTMTAPSGNFTLLGNFSNTLGTFTHNSGTVIFAGADSSTQTIAGNNTFYNFTASTSSNSAGRTIQFVGNSTTTVSGTWTITGFSGKIITLQSNDTNNWEIYPTSASVTYVDIYRSTNLGATFCATYSTKDANTSGWNVSAGDTCITAFNCQSNTASGNWNATGSWTNCDGGYPNSDDTATILNGHTITLNTNAEIVRIDIQNGGTLSADSNSRTLTLNDTTGTLFTLGGTGTFTANNSTVIMNPDAAVTLISGSPTFYNLTLSPTITADRTYTAGAGFSASNNFTINPTAASGFRLTVNLGGTTTITGTTLVTGTTSGISTLDTTFDNSYSLSTGFINIGTAGTLTANNSYITLTGTSGTLFTRVGTFTYGSSIVTVESAGGTPTLNSGTISFDSLIIDPNFLTINTSADAITVVGDLDIALDSTLSLTSGQNLTHSGATLTLGGTLSGDGLYIYQSATTFPTTGTITADLRMDATNNNQSLAARTYGGDVIIYNNSGASARTTTLGTGASQTLTFSGDFTITAANTQSMTATSVTHNPTVNIANDFTIGSDTTYAASSGTLTVGRNFANSGTFTNNSGTVAFNNASLESTLSGTGSPAITFHNLSVTTAGKTVKFTAGQTFRTNGLLTITGSSGPTYVYLTSTNTSSWYINHQGTESITYANVSYSQCSGSTDISANDGTSQNGGGNGDCWIFPTPTPSPTVAYWKFDENTGTTAYDSSGNDHTATLTNGPTWVSGQSGSAVALDGVDDFIITPDSISLSPTSSLTISGWVRMSEDGFSNSTNHNQGIVDKGDYQFYLEQSDGKAYWVVNDAAAKAFYNLDAGLGSQVDALIVHDGSLYAGGEFTDVGSGGTACTGCNYVARWTGSAWTNLDRGLGNTVRTLAIYNGSLYAGGLFTSVGSGGTACTGCNRVSRWTGSAWTNLDAGLGGTVTKVVVYDGSLYASGSFTDVGSGGTACTGCNYVARWTGSAWTNLDRGLGSQVNDLVVYDSSLYAGGNFTNVGSGGTACTGCNYVARWTGSAWTNLDRGLGALVSTFAIYNGSLYAGGNFTNVGVGGTTCTGCNYVARWTGSAWTNLDRGVATGVLGTWMRALVVYDGSLYAGGNFTNVGSLGTACTGCNFIARWGTPNTTTVASTTNSWVANTWYHFALTYDENYMRLYIDGELESTNTNPPASITASSLSLLMGKTYGDNHFKGTLDEIRIYDYAQTEAQILADMDTETDIAYLHWRLDEGHDATAHNVGSGGASQHGTITNGTWTNQGKFGRAITFASNTTISATITDPGNTNTLSLWVYPTTSAASKTLITASRLTTDSSSRPVYGTCVGTALALNTWTHLVAISDGAGSCSLYQNGVQTATNTTGVTFGTSFVAGASSFTGRMDEIKLYTTAFTADQVLVEYNQAATRIIGSISTDADNQPSWSAAAAYCPPGQGTACTAPIVHWKLDENTGIGTADRSENGNHGSFTGTPTWKPGKLGSSLEFNGTSQAVTATITDPGNTNTLSLWVYPTTSAASKTLITAGKLTTDSSSRPVYGGCTGTALTLNTWTHLTAVSNGASICSLYQNGIQTATGTTGVTFGTSVNLAASSFSGRVDDVIIYNYVRTPAQIAWEHSHGAPITWYKFDENSGSPTTIYDSSGSSNNGTAYGTMDVSDWVTGKFNSALDFDGTNDYVATSNIALIRPNTSTYNQLSWSAWISPTTTPTSKTIIHKNNEFRLTTNASGYPQCEIYSGSWQTAAAATSAVPASQWSHLTCTYNGAQLKLFINGRPVASPSQTNLITSSSSTALNIARDSAGSGYFAGKIDDVRIYNYAVNETQIKLLMNQGAAASF